VRDDTSTTGSCDDKSNKTKTNARCPSLARSNDLNFSLTIPSFGDSDAL
jgi:hypothetical protein